ncbi:MAG TPA: hypothetical protein VL172_15605, partial [Kofleriaceae bacterium]|nr:hypothetical protein [Kofleriaceae bacterium]
MRTSRVLALALATALLPLVACTAADDDLDDGLLPEDGKTDSSAPSVSDDNLNGIWKVTTDGVAGGEAVIESWSAVGIRLTMNGTAVQLTRSADTLTGTGATLTVEPNEYTTYDDTIEGTLNGKSVVLERDVSAKDPITTRLPGDRSYYNFLRDTLMPQAQRDRESYKQMRSSTVGSWLKTCELYKSGS